MTISLARTVSCLLVALTLFSRLQGENGIQIPPEHLFQSDEGVRNFLPNPSYEKKEFERIVKKAELGEASAQFALGYWNYWHDGQSDKTDYKEAIKWFKKSAEQGNSDAYTCLGKMYDLGWGVTQSDEKALYWYQKGVASGNAWSAYSLGACYSDEVLGLKFDWDKHNELWEKAAQHEDYYWLYRSIAERYRDGIKYVSQDYDEAFKWYSKGAKRGDSIALAQINNIGAKFVNGHGVTQDYKEAVKWFRKAAEHGYALAQYNLGSKYYEGEGVIQDYKEAVKWYRKAAEQGLSKAQFSLGFIYSRGEGVIQDYKEAVKWYRKAAEQGYADAQSNLGLMYDNGKGVIQDYIQAHAWYNVASANGRKSASINRNLVAKDMTPEQIAKAQELAKELFEKYQAK